MVIFASYGRFRSSKIVTAKHTTISIAMATTDGMKYRSVIDGAATGGE